MGKTIDNMTDYRMRMAGKPTLYEAVRGPSCSPPSDGSASQFKLTAEEMAEAEAVIEEMGNDPDALAYELVWRRHHVPNAQNEGSYESETM